MAASKIGAKHHDTRLIQKSEKLAKLASEKIELCYSPHKKAYTQAIGSEDLDASTLQLITMRYHDPASQRAQEHLMALEKELKIENGLFYRYRHEDDFGKPESTFLVCAFWYVEALACVDRVNDAKIAFENLLKLSNDLGLFSEYIHINGSQWGNFPQTYSHVGLMNAAFRISRKLDPPMFL